MSTRDLRFIKYIKRHQILSIILIFIIILTIGIAIPLLMTSGVEKFEGKEREAAEAVISYAPSLGDPMSNFFSGHLKTRVESVYPTSPEVAKSWCNLPENESGEGYYSVVISERTIFGIVTQEFARHDACVISSNP